MPRETIERCTECHSADCDGVLWECDSCGRVLCTDEIADSYVGYSNRRKEGYHLCVRGHGQAWDCGPLRKVGEDYPVEKVKCTAVAIYEGYRSGTELLMENRPDLFGEEPMIETIGREVEKERFTVYLPVETIDMVKRVAVFKKMRYSKLVNDAILAHLVGDSDGERGIDGTGVVGG